MDEYPKEIVQDPQPLIFFIGTVDNEPDFHQRLIRSFDGTNVDNSDYKEFPKLAYFICPSSSSDRNVYQDVQFPTKKLPKELPTTEGILRSDWLIKHHEQLPSVVLFITSFSVDWSLSEWIKREAGFHERYSRLKATLGSRDCNIIYLLIKIGSLGLADKDVVDERISSLKRHLQLDSKTLHVLTVAEIVTDSPAMKRTLKTVRDASFSYYTHLFKKLKLFERLSKTKGMFEHGLSIRYNIKVGFISEFLGQIYQSLQFYKQAFKALEIFSQQFIQDTLYYKTDNLLDQTKCLADYINFKICKVLIKNGQYHEAYLQFKLFISIFSKLRTNFIKATLWKHYIWLARQFVVYVELLDQFAVTESATGTLRSYYYENAAQYFKEAFNILNQKSNEIANTNSNNSHNNSHNHSSWQLIPPKYFSYLPAIYDQNQNKVIFDVLNIFDFDQNASVCYEFMTRLMLSNDLKIDHKGIILYYLTLALDHTDRSSKRQCARMHMLIADHHMLVNQFELACTHYTPIVTQLISDKWTNTELFISIIKKKNQCEYVLGYSDAFIQSALIIYSFLLQQLQYSSKSSSNSKFTATVNVFTATVNVLTTTVNDSFNNNVNETEILNEMNDIFRKILHILQSNDNIISENSVGNVIENSPTSSSNHVTIFQPSSIPYRVPFQECIHLFDVNISYNHKTIELGSPFAIEVNFILTSLLKYDLYIKELILHFSSPSSLIGGLIKKYKNSNLLSNYDNNNNNNNNENDNDNNTSKDNMFEYKSFNALLSPESPLHLNFILNIPENMFDTTAYTEWIIFLESFELMTSFPLHCHQTQNNQQINEMQGYRDVTFLVPTIKDKFFKIYEKNMKTTTSYPSLFSATDILKYTDESILPPAVLVLKPPKPVIEIIPYTYIYENNIQSKVGTMTPMAISSIDTIPVTKLCQGILQQMNVYFRIDQCSIYNCKVYLSVDYSPDTYKSSFFWYPDIESLQHPNTYTKHTNAEPGMALDNIQLQQPKQQQQQWNGQNNKNDENISIDLDQLRFYPFALNASMQPAQPLFINNLQQQQQHLESESRTRKGFIFCIPLFIRAELEGLYKIKFMFEYQTNPRINSQIYSTECYLDTIFQNPIDLKFKITPSVMNNSTLPLTVSVNNLNNNTTNTADVPSTDPVTLYSNILSHDHIDSSTSSTSQSSSSNNNNSSSSNNSVLRGETLTLSSYITCTSPVLNQYIQLQNITAHAGSHNSSHNHNGINSNSSSSFLCLDSRLHHHHHHHHIDNTNTNNNAKNHKSTVSLSHNNNSDNKHHSSSHIHTLLKAGELFCHYTQFLCKKNKKNQRPTLQDMIPSFESLGYVTVSVKLIDFNFMRPPPKLILNTPSNFKNVINLQQSMSLLNINDCNKITINDIQNISNWLFPIVNLSMQSSPPLTIENVDDNIAVSNDSSSECTLNKSVYLTRVSKFVYSSPNVHVIETPFIVHFIQPKTIQLGNHIIIECKIKNNLYSVERIMFHVSCPTDVNSNCNGNPPFLLRGVSHATITLMPQEVHTVKLTVVPLIAGELKYPEMSVTWLNEENNSSVVNNTTPQSTTIIDQNSKLRISFTNNENDRNVFVFP